MTAITKTKTTKIREVYPPREIIDAGTKPRRAWIAAENAKIETEGFVTKVVGQGSYEHIVVYKAEQVEARVQTRGTCQFCGGLQAVNEHGLIVLHGYQRPGWGYTVGSCFGVGRRPAEVTIDDARQFIVSMGVTLARVTDELKNLKARLDAAGFLWHWSTSGDDSLTVDMMPKTPEADRKKVRELQDEIRAYGSQIRHVEKNVIPQHGKPLTTVLI